VFIILYAPSEFYTCEFEIPVECMHLTRLFCKISRGMSDDGEARLGWAGLASREPSLEVHVTTQPQL
jgi:hypothetical protein